MTGGVALIDYDGDGWEDVYFVNGAKLKDPQPDKEVGRRNSDGVDLDSTLKPELSRGRVELVRAGLRTDNNRVVAGIGCKGNPSTFNLGIN